LALRELIAGMPRMRAMVRALRALPDRLLHPRRRRRAQATLARLGPVRRIVVLCLANINRSPFAAALLRARFVWAGIEPPEVISAGFIGPGRPSPPGAIALAAARGLDLSGHRSRVVSADTARNADLVLVMSARQARKVSRDFEVRGERIVVLGDLDPELPDAREIVDPYDQRQHVYEWSFARIERCVDAVVDALVGSRPGSESSQHSAEA